MPSILIIEHLAEVRGALTDAVVSRGWRASPCSTEVEGVGASTREKFDAAVIDLDLRGHGGISALRALRADPRTERLPVLMLTAKADRDQVLRVAQLGIRGVLVKDQNLAAAALDRLQRLIPGLPAVAATPRPAQPTPATPTPTPTPAAAASAAEDEESLRSSALQLQGEALDIDLAMSELKALKPLMSRSALLERVVEGADLRAMKPAAQQVLTLTGSASASIDSIAKAIKQDQALSVKVLKIANSPLYTRGERVETVQKAVARIGVAQIRTTVMSLSVVDRFASVGLGDRIRPDWFWEHSIACGLIASRISNIRGGGVEAADTMFTAGLLHDVGRTIYAERLGADYTGVIKTADQLEMPLETVESRLLLINHADLTDRVLRQWNFSADLINPIALHHLSVGNIRRVAPRMAEQVATLALANRMAHALLLGCSGNEALYPLEEFTQFLRLSDEHIATLCAAVPELTQDLKLQMLSHGGAQTDSLVVDARKSLPVPPRPLSVGLNPAADPVRIVLDRITDGGTHTTPNIAVVRVNAPGERAQLMSMLRAAKEGAGVKALPTLVVGSGAGCLFTDGALGDRPLEQVVIPLRLTRLLRSMSSLLRP